MDRIEYAYHNRERYLEWTGNVAAGPFDAIDMMEWAIISAHTKFEPSFDGFLATRGVEDLQGVADCLYREGVLAPNNKAAYILDLRDRCLYGETPLPEADYRTYRRAFKFKGLGHCKLSFGACLIDPHGSDIICLDTHMLQVYLGYRPDTNEVNRIYRKLELYESIEDVVLAEARDTGLPAFAYQWAVWDWKRAKYDHLPPSNHSFLWADGRTQGQIPLFGSLDHA